MQYDFIKALNQRADVVSYDKRLVPITGSVVGALILQQIIDRDQRMGGEFHKFTSKPKGENELYQEGSSRNEELGISPKTFNTAIKKFGFKLGKSKNIIDKKDALVTYYTNSDRITKYTLNRDLLNKLLEATFNKMQAIC